MQAVVTGVREVDWKDDQREFEEVVALAVG